MSLEVAVRLTCIIDKVDFQIGLTRVIYKKDSDVSLTCISGEEPTTRCGIAGIGLTVDSAISLTRVGNDKDFLIRITRVRCSVDL